MLTNADHKKRWAEGSHQHMLHPTPSLSRAASSWAHNHSRGRNNYQWITSRSLKQAWQRESRGEGPRERRRSPSALIDAGTPSMLSPETEYRKPECGSGRKALTVLGFQNMKPNIVIASSQGRKALQETHQLVAFFPKANTSQIPPPNQFNKQAENLATGTLQ